MINIIPATRNKSQIQYLSVQATELLLVHTQTPSTVHHNLNRAKNIVTLDTGYDLVHHTEMCLQIEYTNSTPCIS